MNDVVVRALSEDEFRASHTLFRSALHSAPAKDEEWERVRAVFQPKRVVGAFDGQLIGTSRSTDVELVVPGGQRVSSAAVTGVAVRADRTRRGVLTALMRYQLTELADRGVTAALLYATEGAIYGRFGYGVATRVRSCTVRRHQARLRPGLPASGQVELLDLDEAERRLPEIYDRIPLRPGMITRNERWWPGFFSRAHTSEAPTVTAVHHGVDGPDGFAVYRPERDSGKSGVLRVLDLHAADVTAFAGLWRFLLSVDLVDTLTVRSRSLEEPLELLFTDPRACQSDEVTDEAWLRLVDVEGALRARSWYDEALVLAVDDPVLERNTGHYLVGPDGVARTEQPADVCLGVDALAMVFAGGWQPSALVDTGWITVREPAIAHRLDERARTRSAPWCGTFF